MPIQNTKVQKEVCKQLHRPTITGTIQTNDLVKR